MEEVESQYHSLNLLSHRIRIPVQKIPAVFAMCPCRHLSLVIVVTPAHVEPSQHPVPPLRAGHVGDELLTRLCPEIVIIVETVSLQLDRAVSDPVKLRLKQSSICVPPLVLAPVDVAISNCH